MSSAPASGALSPLARLRLCGLAIAVAVLVLDQLTKWVVVTRMELGDRIPVIPGLFDLTSIRNLGGVWGLGRDMGDGARLAVFLALPVLITAFAVWYAWTLPVTARLQHAAIAMVIGGAAGNLIDRLVNDPPAVIDFVVLHFRGHEWPAFNLADSAICIGVGLLLALTLREGGEEAAPPSPS